MVRDFNILREAIDANPNLFSARLNLDCEAIMIELNKYLPDGKLVSVMDVKRAMDLRPVPVLTGVVQSVGHAIGRGETDGERSNEEQK